MIDYGELDRDRPSVPYAQACSDWCPLEWAIVVQQHCDENRQLIRSNAQQVWRIRAALARRRAA